MRDGVLFRSDGLHRLGEAGRAELRQLGVGIVIDLRDENEARFMPDDLDGLDVEVLSLPVFEGSGASQGAGGISLDALYERIVTQHASVVVSALREIASAGERSVVVHCTAGKDRTGIVVALALLAVGVDREAVVEDYARTEANLAGEWLEEMVALVGRYGVPDTPELRILMGGSPREAIEGVLDTVERGARHPRASTCSRRASACTTSPRSSGCSSTRPDLHAPARARRAPASCPSAGQAGSAVKRASTDASITRSCGANSVGAAPPTSATARIIMAFGMGVGCGAQHAVVGELHRHGRAESERRRVDLRLGHGVGDGRALGGLLHARPRGIRQPPVDAADRELVGAGRVADPLAEPPEVAEDDLDVGARLVHDRQLPALVVPRAVRPDPQLVGRPLLERAGCLELAHGGEQALVRGAGAPVDVVAARRRSRRPTG